MYKLSLVKKRKKVRRATIITCVGAVGVIALAIVAFLGNRVGVFTINMHTDGVYLTLSESSEFEEGKTCTYLSCDGLTKFSGNETYSWLEPDFPMIHSEEYDYKIGQEIAGDSTTLRFFKYTFFIKNIGDDAATYDMDINLEENVQPSNADSEKAAPLNDYLRLAIFEGEDCKTPVVYANRSWTKEKNNEGVVQENISTPTSGLAEIFDSEKGEGRLTSLNREITVDEVHMYTFLFWLEGEDPECVIAPQNASLRIGATINAYHKKQAQ